MNTLPTIICIFRLLLYCLLSRWELVILGLGLIYVKISWNEISKGLAHQPNCIFRGSWFIFFFFLSSFSSNLFQTVLSQHELWQEDLTLPGTGSEQSSSKSTTGRSFSIQFLHNPVRERRDKDKMLNAYLMQFAGKNRS